MTASGAQYDASVPAVDGPNDLALLKAGGGHREPATLRAPRRAVLGEPVTVAGFPLSGLLADGLNVTGGEISALAGPANDARVMQITAPVQSGNGGGPPLDKSGRVIGVVVSKLDAPEVYRVTGELPQNVNFAVKGALLRGFLDIHGVHYRTGDKDVALSGENVAAKAGRFVVPVGCWRQADNARADCQDDCPQPRPVQTVYGRRDRPGHSGVLDRSGAAPATAVRPAAQGLD